MFARVHHQAIAQLLYSLDAELLRSSECLFGGGTAITLRHGEYRESVDVDFLVSSTSGYRRLRQLSADGIGALSKSDAPSLTQARAMRIDQYGIRTMLSVMGFDIKFEIVLEGRVELEAPGPADSVCGVATLSLLDMATSKLLANADRCHDDGAFNRDVIDLAMMMPSGHLLEAAVAKARTVYGDAVLTDLAAAIDRLENRHGWIERCMSAMAMDMPKAVLWKHVRRLKKQLGKVSTL